MKAAYYCGNENIQVEEVQVPDITDREMLMKIKLACICGTDQRIYRFGHFKIPKGTKRVLGHELVGEIVKVGKEVKGYKKGQRIAVAPNVGCGVCDMCVQGYSHMCPDYDAFGISFDGGFEEYMRIPSEAVSHGNVLPIPDGMSYEEAVLAEPFSCCFNSFQMLHTKPTDYVLIIGAGPIGAMHAILHQRAGAAKVIMADLSSLRLEQMKAFGEFTLIDTSKEELEDALKRETNGHGADVVITACSVPSVQIQALELTAPMGRISFFGGLPSGRDEVGLHTNLIHYKELTVVATTGSSIKQYRDAMNIIASQASDIAGLITDKYAIDDIQEAFQHAMSGKGLKTAIKFD